jgi:hypothetical protein
MKKTSLTFALSFLFLICFSQDSLNTLPQADTVRTPVPQEDTTLRIINLNPFFSLHVDSTVNYQFQINRNTPDYFWYLRNAPVGVRINKDNGVFNFKAEKSYFLSGKLKYDYNYNVSIGVQNLRNPKDKIDTSFIIVFFNTEIIQSELKPTVSGTVYIDEGETLSFKVLCETGSFPFESIITSTSAPIGDFVSVQDCNQEFKWLPSYDFVKESDSGKVKSVIVKFIGSTKFKMQDTAQVRIIVRNALNYPVAVEQYKQLVHELNSYVLKLKFTFLQLDKNIKKTKRSRTAFDLTAASSALSGTILSTSKDDDTKRTGLILPSVGLILTPLKEASAPTKTAEQNQATLIRSSIKRIEYVVQDNVLIGDKDPELNQKINRLKEEYKQSQMQLIDVPLEVTNNMTEEELNTYFNSMKVNKNYRLKKK